MQGIFVPAGTPKEIVDLLNREIAKADGAARRQARNVPNSASIPSQTSRTNLRPTSRKKVEKWGKVIKDAKIPPNSVSRHPDVAAMRIVDIRETAIPLKSTLANSSFDFTEMTTSVVAVITDVVRNGKPICGFAFNSTGRYACGAQMRARFIPRILARRPESLLDADGNNLDPAKISRLHDAAGKGRRTFRALDRDRHHRSRDMGRRRQGRGQAAARACSPSVSTAATFRKGVLLRGRRLVLAGADASGTCRTRCAAISMPATQWSR